MSLRKRSALRFGLLGLGQVGRNIIRRHGSLGFNWICDSEGIWRRSDGASLRTNDLTRIMDSKISKQPKHVIPKLKYDKFDSLAEQTNLLQSTIAEPKNRWIIIDSTYVNAKSAFEICRTTMGCLAYCGANKTHWAEYNFCKELYEEADRENTFLCLNCVQGVWLDQMEYLPVLLDNFESGRLTLLKRDNPSLNLFYEKIWKKIAPSQAFYEIGKQGYLEPSASDLLAEVKDQWIKAKITENFCSILTKIKSQVIEQLPTSNLFTKTPKSAKPENIADWHISNRKEGKYPALTSRVQLETDPPKLKADLAFINLPTGHPLAKDFGGRNAFCIEATDAHFTWTRIAQSDRPKFFTHSGFGGARKTADKLAWEAKRISRFHLYKRKAVFNPIPVVFGLSVGEAYANRVKHELSKKLGTSFQ